MRIMVLVLGLALALTGCSTGDDQTVGVDATVPVAEVLENVAYYYACGDEVLVLPDGRRWFPLIEQERVDPARYRQPQPAAQSRAIATVSALSLAVAPPRPGDDIGTLVVYQDGMARYRSNLGTTAWLTQELVTYPWVC